MDKVLDKWKVRVIDLRVTSRRTAKRIEAELNEALNSYEDEYSVSLQSREDTLLIIGQLQRSNPFSLFAVAGAPPESEPEVDIGKRSAQELIRVHATAISSPVVPEKSWKKAVEEHLKKLLAGKPVEISKDIVATFDEMIEEHVAEGHPGEEDPATCNILKILRALREAAERVGTEAAAMQN